MATALPDGDPPLVEVDGTPAKPAHLAPAGTVGSQRLRHLATIDTAIATTRAGAYQLSWLISLIDQDPPSQAGIRRLDGSSAHSSTNTAPPCVTNPGIGPVNAAVLLCETGDPARFATEAKFARWCGTGPVALPTGETTGEPVCHRLDFRGNRTVNSVLYTTSITQYRYHPDAQTYITRKRSEGKTPEKPDEPTNATSPTKSSAASGETNKPDNTNPPPPLDKEGSV